jgi:hypothetical protein
MGSFLSYSHSKFSIRCALLLQLVVALSSCAQFSVKTSGRKVPAIAGIAGDYSGYPTGRNNTLTFKLEALSKDTPYFRYKVGPAKNIACTDAEDYSDQESASASVSVDLSEMRDGDLMLCALGGGDGFSLDKITEVFSATWEKDTAPDDYALGTTPAEVNKSDSFEVTFSGTFDSFEYKVGSSSTVDCSDEAGYSVGTGENAGAVTVDAAAYTDGQYNACVRIVDDLGNKTPLTDAEAFTWYRDTTPPVVASGTLTESDDGVSLAAFTWQKATDAKFSASELTYQIYRSGSNNISTAADAIANGTSVLAATTDIATGEVATGTSTLGQTRYFNVVVRDPVGNAASYTTKAHVTDGVCGGAGSVGTPYLICTLNNLSSIRSYVETGTPATYFKLNNDIDASATSSWNSGAGWDPIDAVAGWSGNLDGNNKTISGLFIDRPTTDNVGLFGTLGSNVSNLTLADVNITGQNKVGALIGDRFSANTGNLQNIGVSGTIEGVSIVGGVAGYNGTAHSDAFIFSAADVTCSSLNCGGIYGQFTATASKSYFRGTVTGTGFIGGIYGNNIASNINLSLVVASGEFAGTSAQCGGIGPNLFGTLTKSIATGSLSCSGITIGGLTGGTALSMTKSLSSVHIYNGSSTASDRSGGIIGNAALGTTGYSISTGNVASAGAQTSGLFGVKGAPVTAQYFVSTGNSMSSGIAASGSASYALATGNVSAGSTNAVSSTAGTSQMHIRNSTKQANYTNCTAGSVADGAANCRYSEVGTLGDAFALQTAGQVVSIDEEIYSFNAKISQSDQSAFDLRGFCDHHSTGTVNITYAGSTTTASCKAWRWKKTVDFTQSSTFNGASDGATITVLVDFNGSGSRSYSFTKAASYCTTNTATNSDGFAAGAGTVGNPWTICTTTHFKNIASKLAGSKAYFKLMNNLDFSDTLNFSQLMTVSTATGVDTQQFSDDFDGNGFTIKNLYSFKSGSNAIFGEIMSNARISGLRVRDSVVVGTTDYSAIITSKVWNSSNTFSDLKIHGHVISESGSAGIIVGKVIGDPTFSNIYVSGGVIGDVHVGGFAGEIAPASGIPTITNVGSAAQVICTGGALDTGGGLIGSAGIANYSRLYATGNIVSSCNYTGGLVGELAGVVDGSNTSQSLYGSYSTGGVVASGIYTGGLIGLDSGSTGLTNVYSQSNVITSNASGYAGGLVGITGSSGWAVGVSDTYSAGSIEAPADANDTKGAAAFYGRLNDTTTFQNMFYGGVLSNYLFGVTQSGSGPSDVTNVDYYSAVTGCVGTNSDSTTSNVSCNSNGTLSDFKGDVSTTLTNCCSAWDFGATWLPVAGKPPALR